MTEYRVRFTKETHSDLRRVRRHILLESGFPRRAAAYVLRISAFCKELRFAPYRGEARVGGVPSFRTIGFEGRVSIVFEIDEELKLVTVIGVHYAGRDIQGSAARIPEQG